MRLLTLTLGMMLCASTIVSAQSVATDSVVNTYHYEADHFFDNCYVGGGITGLYNHGSNASKAKFQRMLNPGASLFAGKHISPYSDVRASINYNMNSGAAMLTEGCKNYRWHAIQLALSYRPSLSNLIGRYDESRNWNLNAVAGIGGNIAFAYTKKNWNTDNAFDRSTRALLDLHVGLSFEYRLNPKWTLGVDALEYFVDNSYDGNESVNNTWDKHFNMLVSLSYNFLNKDKETRAFRNVHYDVAKFDEVKQRLADLRDANKYLDENPPVLNDTTTSSAHKIYQMIAFDANESEIHELQQTHIHVLGLSYQRLKQQACICIVNATDSSEGLFQQRAQSIIAASGKDFAPVPAKAFRIYKKESDINFKELPYRNVIIFLVNE